MCVCFASKTDANEEHDAKNVSECGIILYAPGGFNVHISFDMNGGRNINAHFFISIRIK